jgi:hypothetical protein
MVSYKNPPPHRGSKPTHTHTHTHTSAGAIGSKKYKNTKRGDQADENKPGGREEEEEKKKTPETIKIARRRKE